MIIKIIQRYLLLIKALSAFKEAEKCLVKDGSSYNVGENREKQTLISQFLDAKSNLSSLAKCEEICGILLSQTNINATIRVGDILGLLIEACVNAGDITKGQAILEQLKLRLSSNINLEYYVSRAVLARLGHEQTTSNFVEEEVDL